MYFITNTYAATGKLVRIQPLDPLVCLPLFREKERTSCKGRNCFSEIATVLHVFVVSFIRSTASSFGL